MKNKKQPPLCKHKQLAIKVVGGSCTVEEIVVYCLKCGQEFEKKTEA
ncbi:hypothetical protein HN014_08015 [Aquimarina sp. TRL1]|nr:hypothetical protein [Aquimarina sp. TRL1]QKX04863.1 hypothetical protein HN014_08015 [Aquimarina sp. TRL1]